MTNKLDQYTLACLQLIDYTLHNSPESLTIVPPMVAKMSPEKVVQKGRNGAPDTIRMATMTVQIPGKVYAELKAGEESRDLLFICHIQGARELLDRQQSPIVLPGERK